MQTTSANSARALAEAGMQALRTGDAANAKRLFEQIITLGAADASAFLGLAYACRRLHDAAATINALDNALSLEPKNLRAFFFKADHFGAHLSVEKSRSRCGKRGALSAHHGGAGECADIAG